MLDDIYETFDQIRCLRKVEQKHAADFSVMTGSFCIKYVFIAWNMVMYLLIFCIMTL